MTIQAFASRYHLKLKQDSCGDLVAAGRPPAPPAPEDNCHIYDPGDGRLGVVLFFPTVRQWNSCRKRLVHAGFVCVQNGDTEGSLLFDPRDERQSKLAIKATGAKKHKRYSEADRARRAELCRAQVAFATEMRLAYAQPEADRAPYA